MHILCTCMYNILYTVFLGKSVVNNTLIKYYYYRLTDDIGFHCIIWYEVGQVNLYIRAIFLNVSPVQFSLYI